jgi:hypothetical protein
MRLDPSRFGTISPKRDGTAKPCRCDDVTHLRPASRQNPLHREMCTITTSYDISSKAK